MSRALVISFIALAALALLACTAEGETTAELSGIVPGSQDQTAPASQSSDAGTADRSQRPSQRAEAAYAQPGGARASTLTIPEGTVIEAELDEALGSATSHSGDPFTASVSRDVVVDGKRAIPAGSVIHGTVKAATPAKRGAGNATLKLTFSGIELPDEEPIAMTASFSDQTKSQKKRNAAIIGGSAAGGALLGRIIGKDTKGAVVGAMVGGAAGTGVVMSKDGEQVSLAAGSQVAVRLEHSIEVPHRP